MAEIHPEHARNLFRRAQRIADRLDASPEVLVNLADALPDFWDRVRIDVDGDQAQPISPACQALVSEILGDRIAQARRRIEASA